MGAGFIVGAVAVVLLVLPLFDRRVRGACRGVSEVTSVVISIPPYCWGVLALVSFKNVPAPCRLLFAGVGKSSVKARMTRSLSRVHTN